MKSLELYPGIKPWKDTLGGNRTPDALLRTEALYPLSYQGANSRDNYRRKKRPAAGAEKGVLEENTLEGTRTPGL